MRKWIHIQAEKCTGCRLCQLICSYHNFGILSLARSRIKVSYYPPGFDVPTLCRHCDVPRCLPACPSKAISKRRNVIVIDEVLCDGCGKCVSACPYDGVFMDPERMKAINCTLCGQCVKECPAGCLTFQEGKEVSINQNERANEIRNRLFERLDSPISREEVGS
jgi:Fe-S-cluster-containing hydrogenase component 2